MRIRMAWDIRLNHCRHYQTHDQSITFQQCHQLTTGWCQWTVGNGKISQKIFKSRQTTRRIRIATSRKARHTYTRNSCEAHSVANIITTHRHTNGVKGHVGLWSWVHYHIRNCRRAGGHDRHWTRMRTYQLQKNTRRDIVHNVIIIHKYKYIYIYGRLVSNVERRMHWTQKCRENKEAI